MTVYDLLSKNEVLVFSLAVVALFALITICSTVFRIVNRYYRSKNIRAHGWPPAHCDADGDFRSEQEYNDA